MPIAVNSIGQATGTNVTTLPIIASGVSAAGGQIFVGIGLNLDGFDDLSDSVGNSYVQEAGSSSGVGAFLFRAFNNIRLPNNGTITLSNSTPFSAHIGAFYVSGLVSGALDGSSAGQGTSDSPLVALNGLPANDYALAIVSVAAGSGNIFTQDPTFSNLGSFNTQSTTEFSVYAGFRQITAGGLAVYQPHLATPATWSALMVALKP